MTMDPAFRAAKQVRNLLASASKILDADQEQMDSAQATARIPQATAQVDRAMARLSSEDRIADRLELWWAAVEVCLRIGDRSREDEALRQFAVTARRFEDGWAGPAPYIIIRRALPLARERGMPESLAWALLANAHLDVGSAEPLVREALQIAAALQALPESDRLHSAGTELHRAAMDDLAFVLAYAGKFDEARQAMGQETGEVVIPDRRGADFAGLIGYAAYVRYERHDTAGAVRMVEKAADIWERAGYPRKAIDHLESAYWGWELELPQRAALVMRTACLYETAYETRWSWSAWNSYARAFSLYRKLGDSVAQKAALQGLRAVARRRPLPARLLYPRRWPFLAGLMDTFFSLLDF